MNQQRPNLGGSLFRLQRLTAAVFWPKHFMKTILTNYPPWPHDLPEITTLEELQQLASIICKPLRKLGNACFSLGRLVEAVRRVFPAAPEGTRKIIVEIPRDPILCPLGDCKRSLLGAPSSHFVHVCFVEIKMRPEHSNLISLFCHWKKFCNTLLQVCGKGERLWTVLWMNLASSELRGTVPGGHQHRRDLLDHWWGRLCRKPREGVHLAIQIKLC